MELNNFGVDFSKPSVYDPNYMISARKDSLPPLLRPDEARAIFADSINTTVWQAQNPWRFGTGLCTPRSRRIFTSYTESPWAVVRDANNNVRGRGLQKELWEIVYEQLGRAGFVENSAELVDLTLTPDGLVREQVRHKSLQYTDLRFDINYDSTAGDSRLVRKSALVRDHGPLFRFDLPGAIASLRVDPSADYDL